MSAELACPKCWSESVIWANVPGNKKSEYGICRDCWHKAKIEKFADAWEAKHDQDGEPEYVAGEDEEW